MLTSERVQNCEIRAESVSEELDWHRDIRNILFGFEGKKAKTERSSRIFGIVNSGDKILFSQTFCSFLQFLKFLAKTFEHINLH